ncbi:efflux RND transporter periplasmic adaptor subunit [Ottowia sp.]|uniref:efflux RND transporter periplasmic adaptor subunit n=1 Tax=Ottowia sp. TaxID=1898956 RepID=UPI002BE76A1C|nr:efflux RND transporter periplasmic adaptor subunit [Ottowia sp.]HOB65358.1 efflux RND transporter periplasmic adaptor subunit [Ottowia sp.]HPZ57851.1 efflux RND transporter periplasmic adaptor subunit [Ottowia sp.]HQD47807.1 efflux RND transporter periplasmic adaptor subunit [Ottowia sp.]
MTFLWEPRIQCRRTPAARGTALTLAALTLAALLWPVMARADWPTASVQSSASTASASYEGTVEAVRQAVVAAQVPGAVVALQVKVGDTVRAGQVLARIDARAAEQGAAASAAEVAAARAALDVAAQDLNRKRVLFQKNYIAKAALEQAEAQYRSAQAQVNAQAAQAGAARTQTGFHTVNAPFDGVVSVLSVERGDMAMPGRALMTVYDPRALRVSAAVPAEALGEGARGARVQLGDSAQPIEPSRVQVLPTVDAASLTRQVRADLPPATGAVPGQFARLWLPGASNAVPAVPRLWVPAAAVVRRSEMTGVYVLGAQGAPQLRQVRLGPTQGDRVEALAGLSAGERVVTQPQAVLRQAAGRP